MCNVYLFTLLILCRMVDKHYSAFFFQYCDLYLVSLDPIVHLSYTIVLKMVVCNVYLFRLLILCRTGDKHYSAFFFQYCDLYLVSLDSIVHLSYTIVLKMVPTSIVLRAHVPLTGQSFFEMRT